MGTPGIWWIDLQIDGVKRGYAHFAAVGIQALIASNRSLARHQDRLPQPGTVIASSFTSPLDCLYLAAIFNPVFTASYPNTRLVQQISLFQAIFRALAAPQLLPPKGVKLVPLSVVLKNNPHSAVVVLPECTTSNGRGILPLSASILSAPAKTKVYPVNLRYSPSDVTTPLPGAYISFLWDLCSRPTHCIRVRIAEAIQLSVSGRLNGVIEKSNEDCLDASFSSAETLTESGKDDLSVEERKILDRIADDLARLGRAKRVGLGVKDKVEFLRVWIKTRTIW